MKPAEYAEVQSCVMAIGALTQSTDFTHTLQMIDRADATGPFLMSPMSYQIAARRLAKFRRCVEALRTFQDAFRDMTETVEETQAAVDALP